MHFHKYHYDYETKVDEMGVKCSTREEYEEEMYTVFVVQPEMNINIYLHLTYPLHAIIQFIKNTISERSIYTDVTFVIYR